jgi:hypothetical protein
VWTGPLAIQIYRHLAARWAPSRPATCSATIGVLRFRPAVAVPVENTAPAASRTAAALIFWSAIGLRTCVTIGQEATARLGSSAQLIIVRIAVGCGWGWDADSCGRRAQQRVSVWHMKWIRPAARISQRVGCAPDREPRWQATTTML